MQGWVIEEEVDGWVIERVVDQWPALKKYFDDDK
jgi:hypothetical protein